MIVWILCLVAFTLTISKCEPPINTYLPPSSASGPSSQYGTPREPQGQLNGPIGQALNNQQGKNYESSGIISPSTEYGVPGQFSSGFQRGGARKPQGQRQSSILVSEYGVPGQQGPDAVRDGLFSGSDLLGPDSSYGMLNALQSQGRPSLIAKQGSQQPYRGAPSSSYGTPAFGNDLSINQNYRESGEPAKYEFSYQVENPETGTQFSHFENRDGDVATGGYNVILPDGRKQVVEYEAGQEGFKPQIRYEGAGSRSGFGRESKPSKNQGYSKADSSTDTFANSERGNFESDRFENGPQGGSYQQLSSGNGYPRKSPSQGLNRQGQGYSENGSAGFIGNDRDGGYSRPQGQGYPSNNQGGILKSQGNTRQDERDLNEDGYPRGGPNGLRGSGY